ncbi:GvpL/GvpF family gas vesicle protein [Kribbella pittospori]|uniref:GvpL/GvpF family gas vesicle protein n=1 Tax=Kribbella pittospori TaxID=722689 RepID=A0A4V2M9D5_9ACTN|nr:GvpL/GvpF family gas vesicle protein [Kribbella pittospori]TCC54952.1 GvpL/GvpF family gas vesicle protein [Kribbella pittospori]
MTESGTYVYAIGRRVNPQRLRGLVGLGGSIVRTIDRRDLVAIVSTVDLEEFGESGLRRNLENLTWLENTARCHDEVIRRSVDAGLALAPFRLATIYRCDQSVRDRIDDLHDNLVAALDRVEGRSEWSVKAYSRPVEAIGKTSPGRQPSSVDESAMGAGVAYLNRRRAELDTQAQATEQAAVSADRLYGEVAAHAEASRRLPSQDQRLSGRTETMALNGTFLVDADRALEFCGFVNGASDRYPALDIEVDGPWPPYSFATLEKL